MTSRADDLDYNDFVPFVVRLARTMSGGTHRLT